MRLLRQTSKAHGHVGQSVLRKSTLRGAFSVHSAQCTVHSWVGDLRWRSPTLSFIGNAVRKHETVWLLLRRSDPYATKAKGSNIFRARVIAYAWMMLPRVCALRTVHCALKRSLTCSRPRAFFRPKPSFVPCGALFIPNRLTFRPGVLY